MTHHKLSFLLSSRQFSKQIEIHYPHIVLVHNEKCAFFHEIKKNENDYLPEDIFIHHLIKSNSYVKKTFQIFLRHRCFSLDIPCIELDDLNGTAQSAERQTILLLAIHYYFVN